MAIRPLEVHPMTITNLTPGAVTPANAGVLPVGNYKGVAAFWDLDKAVNQPLVSAEKLQIVGKLRGSLEGFDLKTLPIIAAAVLGTTVKATLTVPAGQVWFVEDIRTVDAGDATSTENVNVRISSFLDPAAVPNADGQSLWAVDTAKAAGQTQDQLFGVVPVAGAENLSTPLRLVGGTVITLSVTYSVKAATGNVAGVTLGIFGYVAKKLVE